MDLKSYSAGPYFLLLFVLMVVIEAIWLIYTRKCEYDWKEAGTSFAIAIGKRVIDTATAGIAASLLLWLYDYRLFLLKLDNFFTVVLFFILFEFCYYWHHRAAHEIRWFWANHSVHHSPNEMNLSVAARLGWTGLLSGNIVFFAPLVLIGFHPFAVFGMLAASLFYQIWIHTEIIDKLPRPLEWFLNTPSHHRVHHAANHDYLDKNYGGVLIIWDRIFGTFAMECEKPRYGLIKPICSYNPFKVALWEWGAMIKDVFSARSISELGHYLFSPPGWSPTSQRRWSRFSINNPFKARSSREKS